MSSQDIECSKYSGYLKNEFINWTSGNERIDDFIQGMQLEIKDHQDVVFEWIPYNQFNEIKKIGKNSFMTVYSATWKNGPLYWNIQYEEYVRNPNKEVALKYLHNLQNPIELVINEAKKYSTKNEAFFTLYGISENPDTNDYILVQKYVSGNEKIDDFIQEMQLKVENTIFKWIPYSQFNDIKETGKNNFMTIYSAIWKNESLHYNNWDEGYIISLKLLHNLLNSFEYIINEAKKYSTKNESFHKLYGISQNPDTNDYILVQNDSINLINWISGNEKIDHFIQEMQLELEDHHDIVFEWIPYNQFNEIKETGKNSFMTVYSAIWKNGPLHYNSWDERYMRDSNKEVALKLLHNLQNSIKYIINEAKKYSTKNESFHKLYGISQNPDTNDYILVQNNSINLTNWTSGNEKIDDFIQERQLKINDYNDVVIEWIPYSQFNEIFETGKNSFMTVYSAIWKNGPLHYDNLDGRYVRDSNKEVALKLFYNLQNPIELVINEVKKYSTKNEAFFTLYGMTENPDTNNYILVQKCVSGNEKIDDFIQEMQLKVENTIFKWIPYSQFNDIKETGKNNFMTIYSATWKNDSLHYNNWGDEYMSNSNKEVALKILHSLQNPVEFVINEVKKYSTKNESFLILYGISQNPHTKDYILVQNNSINHTNWISGNEKIDYFIQEMQLELEDHHDIVFEWIPYNHFNKIEKTGKNSHITVYSAIWRDGPLLHENRFDENYTRESNKEVALKFLHNLQNPIEFAINEVKKYSTNNEKYNVIYGISQSPDTNDYILVFNWTSGNEKIDNFIHKRQLEINTVFEWIPYNHLNKIEKLGKNFHITVYSAIWKNSIRDSNKEVALKLLHNLQNPIESIKNEVKKYSTKNESFLMLYGISQNPDTSDYILVQNNSINLTNWISGNEKIDDFIQKRQLKVNDYNDVVIEWIPYSQFNEIKKTGKNSFMTVYSAIWKDGPLYYNGEYTRDSNKEVALKLLHKNSVEFIINEAKKYSTKNESFLILYGISQSTDTNDYILVQNNSINLTNWISENEKIDDFIQEMQLKINNYNDVIVEWIPFGQFKNIKKIGNGGFSTVYSAEWKGGPLEYDVDKKIYKRDPNQVIALKCLYNSQNITNEFLNEIKEYSIAKGSNILNIHGISQNPDTKDYIMVLKYVEVGSFNNWINVNFECFNWQDKLFTLINIINGLKEIHQNQRVHGDFHAGNILFSNSSIVYISDMGLCKDVSNVDKTNIYGVMPYMAPEVLRGKPYTQAADIYSFGMIMYFVATGRQPFANYAHDKFLALDICKGNRPEINEPEAPECYIELMKKCWDSNSNNRPNVTEVEESISLLLTSIYNAENYEIKIQFEEAEDFRKAILLSIEDYQATTHPQAIYISRLLNPLTKDLNSECLDHAI